MEDYWSSFYCLQRGAPVYHTRFGVNIKIWDCEILSQETRNVPLSCGWSVFRYL